MGFITAWNHGTAGARARRGSGRVARFCEVLEPRVFLAGDVVLAWNDIACEAVRHAPADHRGPAWISRTMAMVQGAVFDAINSIDHSYDGYLVHKWFARSGSLDAA